MQKALTPRPPKAEDEPEPPRKKDKGDSEKGRAGFVVAASKIMWRVSQIPTGAADKITSTFSNEKAAVAARLQKIFDEIEAEPCEGLDPANPYWDFSLEADSSGSFDTGYDDSGGASLHL